VSEGGSLRKAKKSPRHYPMRRYKRRKSNEREKQTERISFVRVGREVREILTGVKRQKKERANLERIKARVVR